MTQDNLKLGNQKFENFATNLIKDILLRTLIYILIKQFSFLQA